MALPPRGAGAAGLRPSAPVAAPLPRCCSAAIVLGPLQQSGTAARRTAAAAAVSLKRSGAALLRGCSSGGAGAKGAVLVSLPGALRAPIPLPRLWRPASPSVNAPAWGGPSALCCPPSGRGALISLLRLLPPLCVAPFRGDTVVRMVYSWARLLLPAPSGGPVQICGAEGWPLFPCLAVPRRKSGPRQQWQPGSRPVSYCRCWRNPSPAYPRQDQRSPRAPLLSMAAKRPGFVPFLPGQHTRSIKIFVLQKAENAPVFMEKASFAHLFPFWHGSKSGESGSFPLALLPDMANSSYFRGSCRAFPLLPPSVFP